MSKLSRDELLQLIPVYVVGALLDDERSQVEALLADDLEAQRIEADYRDISVLLPLSVKHQPAPADLKSKLFQRIHEDSIAEPQAEATPPETLRVLPPRKEKRKGNPRQRYILPLVAGLVVVMVGMIFVLTTRDESASPQTIFRNLYQEADTEKVYVSISDDSSTKGTLLISNDGEDAVLRVEELPSIATDQIFQLWMVDADGPMSGGIYQADERSQLYVVIPTEHPVYHYVRFGLSIEPEGGSPLINAPSGERIFSVSVPEEDLSNEG